MLASLPHHSSPRFCTRRNRLTSRSANSRLVQQTTIHSRSYQNLEDENVVVVRLFGLGDFVLVGGVFQIGLVLAPGDLRLGLAFATALDFDRLLFGVLARLGFLEGGRGLIRLLEIRLVA